MPSHSEDHVVHLSLVQTRIAIQEAAAHLGWELTGDDGSTLSFKVKADSATAGAEIEVETQSREGEITDVYIDADSDGFGFSRLSTHVRQLIDVLDALEDEVQASGLNDGDPRHVAFATQHIIPGAAKEVQARDSMPWRWGAFVSGIAWGGFALFFSLEFALAGLLSIVGVCLVLYQPRVSVWFFGASAGLVLLANCAADDTASINGLLVLLAVAPLGCNLTANRQR